MGMEGQVVKDDFALILSDRVDGEKRNEETCRRQVLREVNDFCLGKSLA